MIRTLALRSRARGRPRPNIFSRRAPSQASRKAKDGLRVGLAGAFARQGGSAGLYGLGNGFGFGIGDLTLGVRSPSQASDLVNGGGISGGCGGGMELFGEHSFSVRDQGPAEGRARFQAKLRRSPKMALASIQIFGEYRDCQITIFPGLAGTPARLKGGFRVSGVSFSE